MQTARWTLARSPGHNSWRLIVDTDFETSWTPIHELDGSLGLDGCNGGVDVLGDDISSVQHTTGHVLAVTGIAFHHLVGWLKARLVISATESCSW